MKQVEKRFADLNSAMQQYFLVTGRQLEPLPPKPVLSDFYPIQKVGILEVYIMYTSTVHLQVPVQLRYTYFVLAK